jgi:hypothetical protein
VRRSKAKWSGMALENKARAWRSGSAERGTKRWWRRDVKAKAVRLPRLRRPMHITE